MSTSESWGVNGHTTRCTSPVSVVLQLRLVSGWGLQETVISAALWTMRLGKGLYLLYLVQRLQFVWRCKDLAEIRRVYPSWTIFCRYPRSEMWKTIYCAFAAIELRQQYDSSKLLLEWWRHHVLL